MYFILDLQMIWKGEFVNIRLDYTMDFQKNTNAISYCTMNNIIT